MEFDKHRRQRSEEEFSVPGHVIKEIGAVAGDGSKASDLIDTPTNPEETTEQEQDKSIEAWALQNIDGAIEKWRNATLFQGEPHWSLRDTPVPESIEDLKAGHPNFQKVFSYLCEAKEKFTEYGERPENKTPEGFDIGEAMNLVLVPWGFFGHETRNRREDENVSLYYTLVELQGFNNFNTEVFENLRVDNIRYRASSTPEEYLEERILREGNWGIMLMQTQGSASPPVTLEESRNIRFLGYDVNKLGIFEAIAYSLQEGHTFQHDESWLPANVFPDSEIPNPNTSHKSTLGKLQNTVRGEWKDKRQVRIAIDGN